MCPTTLTRPLCRCPPPPTLSDTFVQLHERPLLHELRRELLRNPEYSGATAALPRVPAPGQLDLSVVRQSTYFFS